MTTWQIWQIFSKVFLLFIVMLVEQVVGVPFVSLLLLYWWFGRRKYGFTIWPAIVFSFALGLLYGGSITFIYVAIGVWWWIVNHQVNVLWLRPLVVLILSVLVAIIFCLFAKRVQWWLVFGWISVGSIIWWMMQNKQRGIRHV